MATTTTQTTGRRKEAIARARLRPGTGVLTVNGRPFDAYFTTPAHRMTASEPLRVLDAAEQFDVDTTITGGGVSGQAGAMRMALARSLAAVDPETRSTLKKAGVLTAIRARRRARSTGSSRRARRSNSPSADRAGAPDCRWERPREVRDGRCPRRRQHRSDRVVRPRPRSRRRSRAGHRRQRGGRGRRGRRHPCLDGDVRGGVRGWHGIRERRRPPPRCRADAGRGVRGQPP